VYFINTIFFKYLPTVSPFLEFSVVGTSVTLIIKTPMMLMRIIFFKLLVYMTTLLHTDFSDFCFPWGRT